MSDWAELNTARKKLIEALGENSQQYFQHVKLWFQMKCSKGEFDRESRKLMPTEHIHLHNEFLLCLFNKCQTLALAPSHGSTRNPALDSRNIVSAKKSKLKKKNRSDKGGFEPVDIGDFLPELNSPPSHAYDEPLRYCAQELFLPDMSLIYGRLLLAAWERGLEGADEGAAEYLVMAVQHLLKNVLTAVLSRKNGYKVRESNFIYGMGCTVPNPWLRSTIKAIHYSKSTRIDEGDSDIENGSEELLKKPTLEDIEQQAAFEIACGSEGDTKMPITSYHILEALEVYPHIIPSDAVYSVYVEKVINKLSHPSHEELDAAS